MKSNQSFLYQFQKTLSKDIQTFQKMIENKKKGGDFYRFLESLIGVKKVLIKYFKELSDETVDNALIVRNLRPQLLKSSSNEVDLNSLMFIFYNIEYEQSKFLRDKFIPLTEKETKYKARILELYDDVIEQIRESYDYNDIRPIII